MTSSFENSLVMLSRKTVTLSVDCYKCLINERQR